MKTIILLHPHLIQRLPFIHPRRVDEIQNPVVNAEVLREGIAAEVHHGGDGAGL